MKTIFIHVSSQLVIVISSFNFWVTSSAVPVVFTRSHLPPLDSFALCSRVLFTSSILRASDLEGLFPPYRIHLAFSALLWPTPGEYTSSFQTLPYFSCTVPRRPLSDAILVSIALACMRSASYSVPRDGERDMPSMFPGNFWLFFFFFPRFIPRVCMWAGQSHRWIINERGNCVADVPLLVTWKEKAWEESKHEIPRYSLSFLEIVAAFWAFILDSQRARRNLKIQRFAK